MARIKENLNLIEIVFAVLTVSSCLTGSKLVEINVFGITLSTPASAFCFVLTFFLSNWISHIAGQEEANKCVRNSAIAQVLSAALFFTVGLLPAQDIQIQSSYLTILGTSWILVIGSLVAFVVSQKVQLVLFNVFEAGFGVKLANIFSMSMSQILDTTLFTFIVFGLGQKMLFDEAGILSLLSLIGVQYAIKMVVLVILSPVFTLLIGKVK